MKMLPEYLEKAKQFARTAAKEKDAWLKAQLEKQAAAAANVAKLTLMAATATSN